MAVSMALNLLSPALLAADQASAQIIIDCGVGAVDEVSLAECVTLKLDQAEDTLQQVEESWKNVLQTGLLPKDDQSVLNGADPDLIPDEPEKPAESTNVIAIVNDAALKSGVSTGGNPVINIDDGSTAEDPVTDESFDESVNLAERFGFLPALFRSYRDQHCAWHASLFGGDRTRLHYQACLVSMTEIRTQELTRYLAAQRSQARNGRDFRGYYVKSETGAFFQACNRRTDWWVIGSEPVLSALDRRFTDIRSQSLANSDVLYAELRGEVVASPGDGPGADFSAAISVRSIGLLRPVSDSDCEYPESTGQNLLTSQSANTQDSIAAPSAATVEDFASSGFLYGYFNYWLAACSVTENSVCSAETEAQFASDGDWQLRVDRSLEGDWRVILVPTTEDQLIEKQLTMQINGADVFLDKSFANPLRLAMNQGVEIADGKLAHEIVAKLKLGRELRLQWLDDANVMSELKFSLLGITRALEYFDSAKS